jgi:hypothetical protein
MDVLTPSRPSFGNNTAKQSSKSDWGDFDPLA